MNIGSFDSFYIDKWGERYERSWFEALRKIPTSKNNFEVSSWTQFQ